MPVSRGPRHALGLWFCPSELVFLQAGISYPLSAHDPDALGVVEPRTLASIVKRPHEALVHGSYRRALQVRRHGQLSAICAGVSRLDRQTYHEVNLDGAR